VFEVLGLGFGLLVLVAVGLVLATVAVVFWVVTLPFRLLGVAFQLAAALLALPFLLLFGLLGATIFGAGMLLFLAPALPFVLLVIAVLWLVRRNRRRVSVA
jgi:glycerol-3-phosphate acyltransferase PlsY